MKGHFTFIGLAGPERTRQQQRAMAGLARPSEAELLAAVSDLWDLPEREYQYAGCDLLDRHARVLTRWKLDTDADLLFELCSASADHTEFFVRQGIGWALREYSKVAPDSVRAFVAAHPELSRLSRCEALKWLDR